MDSRRLKARRADNSNALWHHNLVPRLRVQIPRAHKATLRGMRVNPSNHQQILRDAIVQQRRLINRLAGIRRAPLLGYDERRHEQRVINRRAAEDAAHLEAAGRVVRSQVQEGGAQLGGEEDVAEGVAVLEVGGWAEGNALGGVVVGGWGCFLGWKRGRFVAVEEGVFAGPRRET